jgi:2-dehydro-3-deoxyphosphogluconate aldolase/(4S)-4-hydroxy-2-oxoglutarate aldolase
MNVRELMQVAPVIPVLVIDDVASAKPLAEALVAGGLRVLEITLRTPAALDAIKAMTEISGAIVVASCILISHPIS